jgi:hypothetical protein
MPTFVYDFSFNNKLPTSRYILCIIKRQTQPAARLLLFVHAFLHAVYQKAKDLFPGFLFRHGQFYIEGLVNAIHNAFLHDGQVFRLHAHGLVSHAQVFQVCEYDQ